MKRLRIRRYEAINIFLHNFVVHVIVRQAEESMLCRRIRVFGGEPVMLHDISSSSSVLASHSSPPKNQSVESADPECPNGQLTNYSYASSTSWDSWTNKTRKEEWDILVKLYSTNTIAQKMQLKQELHNVQRNKLSINEYSMKVKGLADSFGSIGAPVDDELSVCELEWSWERICTISNIHWNP